MVSLLSIWFIISTLDLIQHCRILPAITYLCFVYRRSLSSDPHLYWISCAYTSPCFCLLLQLSLLLRGAILACGFGWRTWRPICTQRMQSYDLILPMWCGRSHRCNSLETLETRFEGLLSSRTSVIFRGNNVSLYNIVNKYLQGTRLGQNRQRKQRNRQSDAMFCGCCFTRKGIHTYYKNTKFRINSLYFGIFSSVNYKT